MDQLKCHFFHRQLTADCQFKLMGDYAMKDYS